MWYFEVLNTNEGSLILRSIRSARMLRFPRLCERQVIVQPTSASFRAIAEGLNLTLMSSGWASSLPFSKGHDFRQGKVHWYR